MMMVSPCDDDVPKTKTVVVRQVWASNLEEEFAHIKSILPLHGYVAIDTEFPGCIYKDKCHYSNLTPSQTYATMKANVDALNIIQLGLTISDYAGNLPDLGTDSCCIWEFNFKDFDIEKDPHDPEAIRMLQRQGINFSKNRVEGISSKDFRNLFFNSGLIFNRMMVQWITFHGCYDFGYLMKILLARELPQDIASFGSAMSNLLGEDMYDMKHLMDFCCDGGFNGGLERLGKTLNVERVAGKTHEAGSDSLLTLHVYFKFRNDYLAENFEEEEQTLIMSMCKGVIYGLEDIIRSRPPPEIYYPCGLVCYYPLLVTTFDNVAV
ncbi:hypothetical protein RIF29_24272 [Crotalaria pallida]|uniref:poly(A)-specific ribonuclease n=1 Tax=Crotalaria pallida TaxID=3830 RepID=A0AAN9EPL1_CROPI